MGDCLLNGRRVLIRAVRPEDAAAERAFFDALSGDSKWLRLMNRARYVGNPDLRSCEFAVVTADGWHHTGVAWLLMHALMDAARKNGFDTMAGIVLRENREMLEFVKSLGFSVEAEPADWSLLRVARDLRAA